MNFNNVEEFYPTPRTLLEEITKELNWRDVHTVLEPSAGKGDIVKYVEEKAESVYNRGIEIDCIEYSEELRATLKGNEYRVVHDDFLTFNTFKKYDLIIMNPPFSNGASHLLKALEMQNDGGAIICILNAETIKNPYTNERKALLKKLEECNATIEYMENEFVAAERRTNVEIAVIKVLIEEKTQDSYIVNSLKKKMYGENFYQNVTDLAPSDFIEALVTRYELEVESGIKLIKEYKAMSPYILSDLRDSAYNQPILSLKVGEKDLSVNNYVKRVRTKYWEALFNNQRFTGHMTTNLQSQYRNMVHELSNYDFSLYNIRCIQIEMSKELIKGVEDCIIALFDELSRQYSFSDELQNNIHYYNGWKTNKSWYINKKVIIPCMNAFSSWRGYDPCDYHLKQKLADIEKALNYLDNGRTDAHDLEMFLSHAKETGQTRKVDLKYFYVTFYKKGTCHIEFKDEELLKKLNIFGSQKKGWLPQGYGTKTYKEMDKDEQTVIDSFEGSSEYEKTLQNRDFFIYNPKNAIPAIEMTA